MKTDEKVLISISSLVDTRSRLSVDEFYQKLLGLMREYGGKANNSNSHYSKGQKGALAQ